MNTLKIQKIHRIGTNRFEYSCTVEGAWEKYFDLTQPMWAEYNTSVEHVPDSIAVLPLVGNFIVLASLMDAEIHVEEIDREFLEATGKFLRGFDEVMPDHVHFKVDDIIHAQRIVDNPATEGPKKSNLLFFSGGVDATYSLVSHMEEKPALVTIWGADISWNNREGWDRAIRFNKEAADRHGLELLTVRSNFRKCYHNDNIEDFSCNLVGDWWWPSFHHSVAMMCLAAPLANGAREKLYLGSSFTGEIVRKFGHPITASSPAIDNHVAFCNCQVVHDGYEASRCDKVQAICDFYQNQPRKPFLRVCFKSDTGTNCGVCEKCTRTIMPILLAGGNPADYGFQYDADTYPALFAAGLQEMGRNNKTAFLSDYADMQKLLRLKSKAHEVSSSWRLLFEANMETLADFLQVPNNEYLASQNSAKNTQQELYDRIGQLEYKLSVAQQETAEAKSALAAVMDRPDHGWAVEELNKIRSSTSWKITKPLRRTAESLRKVKRFLRKLARIAKAFLKQDDYWQAIAAKLRDMAFQKGAKMINRTYPEGTWKNDYTRWRWWFITSDQYKTRMKPEFNEMLKNYEGKLWNRGFLLKLDYWLCWIFFGAEPDDYFNYEYFRKGWAWRNHHVTKQRLNFIDPIFNSKEHVYLIRNKADFYAKWDRYLNRNWCVPQNISLEEFRARFGNAPKLMVKPIDLYGGKGIYTVDLNGENLESVYSQLHDLEHPVVVEEYIQQKGFLNEVCPNTLNPLRVTTIRVGDRTEVCYGFFTTGRKGSVVSNDCSGGICFSVDTATGRLGMGQGMSSNGFHAHPDTGVEVAGKFVPDWDRIKEFACEAHQLAPEGIGMIGWDICWSDGTISIIEGNNGPGFAELPNKHEDQWGKVQEYLNLHESLKK